MLVGGIMEPLVLAYDANGNIILNLKERLTRIEGGCMYLTFLIDVNKLL